MALTDLFLRGIKPPSKTTKFYDADGLFIMVTPAGGRLWRLKYRFGGKEKLLALGSYPEVSLRDARDRRTDARRMIASGIDPAEQRKAQKAARAHQDANGFEVVAREWIAGQKEVWSEGHIATIVQRLDNDVFPHLGTKPVGGISPQEVLAILRRVEKRGALETAHRIMGVCSQVFRYAVATGRAESDPCRDLRGALPPVSKQHLAAVTDPKKFGELLLTLESYDFSPIVSAALRLAPLVFVRPAELQRARWADIDLKAAEWRYFVSKTKTHHIVPLAKQAVAILSDIWIITGTSPWAFPSPRSWDRPITNVTVLGAMRRLGITKDEACVHGFRATARTLLDEVLGFPPHLIEHQLAHTVKDALGRAYNRTKHLPERKAMMQAWADYLDELKAKAVKPPAG